jgi:hypothetical protein
MGLACTLHRASESRMQQLIEEPDGLAEFLDPPDPSAPRVVEVRPTGRADETSDAGGFLLSGGEDLDDEGQARALGADSVRRIAAFLGGLTPAELERRYDPARMTKLDIYPARIWLRESAPEKSALSYLLRSFNELNAFMAKAAAAGDGVIVRVA